MKVSIAPAGLTQKPRQGDSAWFAAYLDSFYAADLGIVDLAEHICRGDSWGPVYSGRPSRDRFVLGQTIGVDLDDSPPLVNLTRMPFVLAYCALIYPTLSWQTDKERYRLVFVLDEPLADVAGYEYAAKLVTGLFSGADTAVANAGRTFYGNGRIRTKGLQEFMWYSERTLPVTDLRVMARRRLKQEQGAAQAAGKQTQQHAESRPLDEMMGGLWRHDPYEFGYDEWVKIGAGLAHTYGDAAFFMFKQWSDRPGHTPLTWTKWRSLATEHRNPAGIGSVIHILRQRSGGGTSP